jgi:phosphate transport system permease protein
MAAIDKTIRKNKLINNLFVILGLISTLVCLSLLAVLLIDLVIDGRSRLNYQFLTSYPSRFPEKAGILAAWVGSFLVLVLTAALAVPLGVAAGIYLEEYAGKNWLTAIIEINIANLAGVPSIVYGLLALGVFVHIFRLGDSILTGGMTLALLILPMIIIATREAIRAIPGSIREASYALGATQWQTISHHILPYSMGGVLTGIIIGLSRAIGETAPLITIGALTFVAFLPTPPLSTEFPFLSFRWIMDPFTILPIQMFNWISRPQAGFQVNAAAAGVVLMILSLTMNALAIYIRWLYRKKIKW